MQALVKTKRGLNEKGESIFLLMVADLQEPLEAINAIIEKYQIVEPERNVKPMWMEGRITVGFNYNGLPLSSNASK